MARKGAHYEAEKKIEEALQSGAKKLNLSAEWGAKDIEKLTELLTYAPRLILPRYRLRLTEYGSLRIPVNAKIL